MSLSKFICEKKSNKNRVFVKIEEFSEINSSIGRNRTQCRNSMGLSKTHPEEDIDLTNFVEALEVIDALSGGKLNKLNRKDNNKKIAAITKELKANWQQNFDDRCKELSVVRQRQPRRNMTRK